jgi:hypothetical protein
MIMTFQSDEGASPDATIFGLDGYMFDTTEFNAVAKRELPLSAISGQRLFATHV